MDEKLLEFWGTLFLNAAKGKKQADETSTMIKKSLAGFNDFFKDFMQKNLSSFDEMFTSMAQKNFGSVQEMSDTFRKMYSFDQLTENGGITKKNMQDFQASFKDYVKFMGFVSRHEHLALVEKYEKLKEKCENYEETVKHLKMLLNEKGVHPEQYDVMKNFHTIVKENADLFRNMIKQWTLYQEAKKDTDKDSAKVSSDNKETDTTVITEEKINKEA